MRRVIVKLARRVRLQRILQQKASARPAPVEFSDPDDPALMAAIASGLPVTLIGMDVEQLDSSEGSRPCAE